uniref:H/ACA ribonucleoprotein complex non-core subunit NAF1 n=1 Tax=Oryza punctata TaxID=4537 RepID=A0A0E0L4D9_ORYPU
MARHPRPPTPSPPRASSDTDTTTSGFDPVVEWLVDFDQAMADEMAKGLGMGEEGVMVVVVPDAPAPASCDAGKVSGVSVSGRCEAGAKEEVIDEKGDAFIERLGASFGGEFDVNMEPETGSGGLGTQLGHDQLPASGFGDLAGTEDGSEIMVDVERSTVPVDADMNNTALALVKEEAEGGGDKEDESSDEEESESSEEETSSSTTSSDEEEEKRANEDESSEASSSSDEEEQMAKRNGSVGDTDSLFEEGELMLASDGDDDEEAPKGPIKSKHEVEVLPPVPKIDVHLEPHHQTLPVGTISAMMGERVIVEGSVQHNPLNEGSILWITESRTPLGIVDELFGPVKNPYYLVRFNSAEEVPAEISAGTAVSFVAEFADHILNMRELYAKGYDGSGENDEDQTDPEFSDDEKEAEYKRSLRLAKRQTDRQHEGKKTSGDKKRAQPRGSGFRKDMPPRSRDGPTPGRQSQPHFHDKAPVVNAIRPLGSQDGPISAPTKLPPGPVHPVMPAANQLMNQMGGRFMNPSQQFLPQQPNVVWPGGLTPTPHPNMGIEGAAFAANIMQNLLIGANQYQQQFQNHNFGGFLNQMPVPPPQFMSQGGMPSNPMAFGGPTMARMNPPFGPPPQLPMDQGNFGQAPHMAGNTLQPAGFPNGQGFGQPASPQGDGEQLPVQFSSGQFNQGNSSFRGRKPQQRGGRHSSGRGGGRHRR